MRPTDRNSLAAVALCLLPLFVAAETSGFRLKHIQDSSNGRQPAKTAFPTYPSIARRDRIEGEATVCFRVDARGKVKRPTVTTYTHRIFRKPVLRAIKQSVFEPLRIDQRPTSTKMCRTYRFRLDPVEAGNTDE